MQVFWHKGYEATSIEDLLSARGLNRGSLCDAFGDTRQLFLKVLNQHCHGFAGEQISLLDQPEPALPTLRRCIRGMIEDSLADPQRLGCLIANSVMELSPHKQEIAGTLRQALKMAEDTILRVLVRAAQQGELKKGQDPQALARFLTTMMQGTIVMIKAGRGVRVELIHTGIPQYDYLPIKKGWTIYYWTPWKKYLQNLRS